MKVLSWLAILAIVIGLSFTKMACAETQQYWHGPPYWTDFCPNGNPSCWDETNPSGVTYDNLDDAIDDANFLIWFYGGCNGPYEYIWYTPGDSWLILRVTDMNQCPPPVDYGLNIYGNVYGYDPDKNNGDPCGCGAGDPVNITTGNEYRDEEDYDFGPYLNFHRFYNSSETKMTSLGEHWRHTYDRYLLVEYEYSQTTFFADVYRPDGKVVRFAPGTGTSWTPAR